MVPGTEACGANLKRRNGGALLGRAGRGSPRHRRWWSPSSDRRRRAPIAEGRRLLVIPDAFEHQLQALLDVDVPLEDLDVGRPGRARPRRLPRTGSHPRLLARQSIGLCQQHPEQILAISAQRRIARRPWEGSCGPRGIVADQARGPRPAAHRLRRRSRKDKSPSRRRG